MQLLFFSTNLRAGHLIRCFRTCIRLWRLNFANKRYSNSNDEIKHQWHVYYIVKYSKLHQQATCERHEVTPFVNYYTRSKWFLIIGSLDYLESICWGSILFMLVWMLCPDHKKKILLLVPVQLRALTWRHVWEMRKRKEKNKQNHPLRVQAMGNLFLNFLK